MRNHYFNRMAKIFRNVPKIQVASPTGYYLSQRRLVERAMLEGFRLDVVFSRLLQLGHNPYDAFKDIIEKNLWAYESKYTFQDIMDVAFFLKDRILAAGISDPNRGLVLGGSFLNGKADLGHSDIDIVTLNLRNYRQIREDWLIKLASLLKDRFQDQTLTPVLAGTPCAFFSSFNNFVLVIEAHQLKLQVYEPGLDQNEGSGDAITAGNYQEYILFRD